MSNQINEDDVEELLERINDYVIQVKTLTDKHEYYKILGDIKMQSFKYVKLVENAKAPEKVAGNAGYDLTYTGERVIIEPGERRLLSTGLILVFPQGYHGIIKPRSGMAFKYGIDVLAGVIDNSYDKETKVLLVNLDVNPYTIEPGDRIAQIILIKDSSFNVEEIKLEDLQPGNRQSQFGFGGSGR